jgi:hypothetical protein
MHLGLALDMTCGSAQRSPFGRLGRDRLVPICQMMWPHRKHRRSKKAGPEEESRMPFMDLIDQLGAGLAV